MKMKPPSPLLLLLFLLIIIIIIRATHQQQQQRYHPPTLLTDKAALLAFKAALTNLDSQSPLADWQNASHVCDFRGVVCNHRRHRVVELRLNRTGIHGPLSPFLANLTRLRSLDLSENLLVGPIPQELGSLRLLKQLDLSGNSLHGPIPDSLSLASNLFYLDIHDNPLTGSIPTSILYNCTELAYVDLSINSLHGQIPSHIGNRLPSLRILQLYSNHLTGTIPLSLANCTDLEWLDLGSNSLSGELPSQTFATMRYLQLLLLASNHFTSHDHNTNLSLLFTALSNCTSLKTLDLSGNDLRGRFPTTIDELPLAVSAIYLEDNRIVGSIPANIANISNLTLLNLSSNILNGTIPVEMGGLRMLQQLILSNNLLTGSIPSSMGQIGSLLQLDLSRNGLTGEISPSIGNLIFLSELFLQENKLSGPIPSAIGMCKSLNKLDLSFNRLTAIPKEILGLSDIAIFLNLSHNLLSGPLPLELSKMEAIQEMDLSSNAFNGSIFPQLEGCIAIRVINLSHNLLQGKLPDSITKLRNLESLDVSYNFLSGEIPSGLGGSSNLTLLNLSYNDFNGSIPTIGRISNFSSLSFLGNPHLCGMNIPGLRVCRKKKRKHGSSSHTRKLVIVATVVGTSMALLLATAVICCMTACRWRRSSSERRSHGWNIDRRKDNISSKSTPSLKLSSFPRITYKELAEATDEFDQHRLIGSGSFGHVYRGILEDGNMVAVKVLHLQTNNSTKSFKRECQVLKRIRHRNLMRIITACSLPEFKALVLPFMANGSLESHLHLESTAEPRPGSEQPSSHSGSELDLVQRVNICSDIAEGMAYLHHHSPVRVIHCDLKPSNVLLNDDMTALVSDFGIARLVTTIVGNATDSEDVGNSTSNMLRGSIGYIAPEYGYGSNASTKGDVYSFGILVLEMVTRKRPTDKMFVGDVSLHEWVKRHYHGRVEKVIDPSLIRSLRDQPPEVRKMWEVAVAELIELGILCSQVAPSTRPTMLDAADDLDRLKRYLTGDTSATFASSLGISSSTVLGEED